MMDPENVKRRLELLVGAKRQVNLSDEEESFLRELCAGISSLSDASTELLDQLLLAVGFNRPSAGFHEYFRSLSGSTYDFDKSLTTWRIACMRRYGNFRYPYRELSGSSRSALERAFSSSRRDINARTERPARLIDIPARDTPLLGYLAGAAVNALAARRAAGEDLTSHEENLLSRFAEASAAGLQNTYEYCTTPYMDVYVATSMRDHEDFFAVHRLARSIFDASELRNASYFDPTQSAHPDRIVKGIVEGLMLRRAAVTVYLAQEGDTLGKDSELASTLAQGKVVIAYVPEIEDVDELAEELVRDSLLATESDPSGQSEEAAAARLLERVKKIDVDLWADLEAQRIEVGPLSLTAIAEQLAERLRVRYERRAQTLHVHPLGLQVNLNTGVANGILVARSVEQCRLLVSEVLDDSLRFKIVARESSESPDADDLDSATSWDRLLVEKRTESVHRVVIGDELILNSFWNWYTESEQKSVGA